MTVLTEVPNILRRAAETIEPEGAWTRGALARDWNGSPIGHDEDNASCFCLHGALARVNGGDAYNEIICDYIIRVIGTELSVDWNDAPERTQAEVVAALRAAADLAESGLTNPLPMDERDE